MSKRNEDAHRDNYRGFKKEEEQQPAARKKEDVVELEQQLSLACRSSRDHCNSLAVLRFHP